MNKRPLTYEREVSQPARCPFWLWELPSSLYIPSSLLVSCTLTISCPQITHLELWARRQRLRLPIVRKSLCCYIIKHDNGTFCICIRRPWFPDSVWKWQSLFPLQRSGSRSVLPGRVSWQATTGATVYSTQIWDTYSGVNNQLVHLL